MVRGDSLGDTDPETLPLIPLRIRERAIVLPKRLIGQGTYGCITYPAFPCDGHVEQEYAGLVSKVLSAKESKQEIEQGARLSGIDTLIAGAAGTLSARFKYGVYALNRCRFPFRDVQEVESWKTTANGPCLAGNGRLESLGWIVHMEQAGGDCDTIEALPARNDVVNNWLVALRNALEGLANMHAHGVFHLDVKPQNMLWFGDELAPTSIKLNDFGLTMRGDDPKLDQSYALTLPWWNFPPSACIAAALLKPGTLEEKKDAALDKYVESTEYHRTRNDRFVNSVAAINYLPRGIRIDAYLGTLQDLCASVDVFGFALTLDYLFRIACPSVKALIKGFCTRSFKMDMNATEALRLLDEMIVTGRDHCN